jgi:hypothetical protein
MTSVSQQISLVFLGALLLALPALARAQVQAPRDPYLAKLERLEAITQAKRYHALRGRDRLRPKPSDCATGRICSDRSEGIQSHQVPGSGLVAVLHDVDLERDALTVRLRFYNDGSEPVRLVVEPTQAYEAYFIEVDGERRFILHDDDGALEAKKPLARVLAPRAMESWWAKFPPLTAGAKAFDVVLPPAPRFETVSVSDD